MTDELGSLVGINLLFSVQDRRERSVVLRNTQHFLGISTIFSTNVLFLQSTFAFAPVEVSFSRRASGFARYPKHSVSRISLVLALLKASEDRKSLQHSLIQLQSFQDIVVQSKPAQIELSMFGSAEMFSGTILPKTCPSFMKPVKKVLQDTKGTRNCQKNDTTPASLI